MIHEAAYLGPYVAFRAQLVGDDLITNSKAKGFHGSRPYTHHIKAAICTMSMIRHRPGLWNCGTSEAHKEWQGVVLSL
eukprot:scaffold150692_cov29-Tisochrysis_lutea.AAC.1